MYSVRAEQFRATARSLRAARAWAKDLLRPVNGAGTLMPAPRRLYWHEVTQLDQPQLWGWLTPRREGSPAVVIIASGHTLRS